MSIRTSNNAIRWIAKIDNPKKIYAEIEKESARDITNSVNVDIYTLYVYENGEKYPQWDYQWEEMNPLLEQAYEQFGIPYSAWEEVYEFGTPSDARH